MRTDAPPRGLRSRARLLIGPHPIDRRERGTLCVKRRLNRRNSLTRFCSGGRDVGIRGYYAVQDVPAGSWQSTATRITRITRDSRRCWSLEGLYLSDVAAFAGIFFSFRSYQPTMRWY